GACASRQVDDRSRFAIDRLGGRRETLERQDAVSHSRRDRVRAVLRRQLPEEAPDVALHGELREALVLRDLLVGEPLRDQLENPELGPCDAPDRPCGRHALGLRLVVEDDEAAPPPALGVLLESLSVYLVAPE